MIIEDYQDQEDYDDAVRFAKRFFPEAVVLDVLDRKTSVYNCFSYTFGITDDWIVPFYEAKEHEKIDMFCINHGYRRQEGLGTEVIPGYERIVLYERNGYITHGARQRADGTWESKLGGGPLIVHKTLECLGVGNGDQNPKDGYGRVYAMFLRPVAGQE